MSKESIFPPELQPIAIESTFTEVAVNTEASLEHQPTLWDEHPITTIAIIGGMSLAAASLAGVNLIGGARRIFGGNKHIQQKRDPEVRSIVPDTAQARPYHTDHQPKQTEN